MNVVPGDQELPLLEHVKELRSRFLVVAAVLILALLVAFPFSNDLIKIIWADLMSPEIKLVVYDPLEWMITKLCFSLVAAVAASVPVFMYELFMFMKKGLYPSEKRFILMIVPTSFVLFLAGISIAYYIVIPLIFNYMIFYSADVASSGLSARQTFSIISTMLIIFGLLFQFPMLVVFSIKSGLLKREQLKEKRILVYGILLGFALFVAPDVTGMSQLIMALLLVILFEFSLLISRFI